MFCHLKKVLTIISLAVVSTFAAATPSISTDTNGSITSISGIEVDNVLYTVRFVDTWICSDAISCRQYLANNPSPPREALEELADLLTTQSVRPNELVGCTDEQRCAFFTFGTMTDRLIQGTAVSYRLSATTGVAEWVTSDSSPRFSQLVFPAYPTNTYAAWSSSAPMPLPSTLVLLGIAGVAGIFSNRRRTR